MKKIVSILTALMLVISVLPTGVFAEGETSSWDGTVDTSWYDDHQDDTEFDISTAAELAGLASIVNAGNSLSGKTINLTADIDLNEKTENYENWATNAPDYEWTAIGTRNYMFEGTFDGKNHTVSGVYINKSDEFYQGLFGYSKCKISNLGVINSYINGYYNVAGISGMNFGTIENCYNTGTVSGTGRVGGVCGYNSGTIKNCYNTGAVSGTKFHTGGVCAYSNSAMGVSCIIENCYNTGSVSGDEGVAGVSGLVSGCSITSCYNEGTVTATSQNSGGVCGEAQVNSKIDSCYNRGTITGTIKLGGVCGNDDCEISNCYNEGYVLSTDIYPDKNYIGGVCGVATSSTISNCYYYKDKIDNKTFNFYNGAVTQAVGEADDTDTVKGLTKDDLKTDYYINMLSYATTQSQITLINNDSTEEKNYIEGIGYDLPTSEKTGYTFNGWSESETFTGNKVTEISDIDTGDKTFYASWTINSYDVNFSDGVDKQSVYYNNCATEPSEPTKTGYSFAGWKNGETEFDFNTPITDNVELQAVWTVNTYDVNLYDNDATSCDELSEYTYGTAVTLPTPEKTGYTFDGWYENASFTGNAVTEISATDTEDKTFFAKWTVNNYNVTLNDNDATSCDQLSKYTYGTAVTLPTPEKTGYTFDGWYDNISFTGDAVTEISATDTENKTFYAKWTANNYNVTLNDNDATSCDELREYTYGTVTTLSIPEKTGYTFAGWYDNETFTGNAVAEISATDIGEKTFYAKYERAELKMLEGENQEWEQGSSEDLRFRSEALLSDFENVTINGSIVDESNYTKESGSTIITLNSDYLETLSAGTYTLAINSTTGSATTEFTINEEAVISDDTTDDTSSTTDTEDVEDTSSTADTEDVEDTSSTTDTEDVDDTSSTTESEEAENPKTGSNILTSLMMLSGLSAVAFVFAKKKIKK